MYYLISLLSLQIILDSCSLQGGFATFSVCYEVDKEDIITNAISFTVTLLKEVKDLRKTGWTEIGELYNGKVPMVKITAAYYTSIHILDQLGYPNLPFAR